MEKEYILTLGFNRVGKFFVDDNDLFHCYCNEDNLEFISLEKVDVNQVMEVLLDEGHDPKFIRIPVRYVKVPGHDKQRNLAISAYSKSGQLKAHMYIHDVVEKVLVSHVNVDGIMVRSLRQSPESFPEEPENISEYTIAERLVYFRKRSGESESSLARKAGITINTWNGIETGRTKKPQLATLELMCDALGITLAEFFATNTKGLHEINDSLAEELKYLKPFEQRILARKLKAQRLKSSE